MERRMAENSLQVSYVSQIDICPSLLTSMILYATAKALSNKGAQERGLEDRKKCIEEHGDVMELR
jgi:hypothetical protein